jgi:hypothetical protein
VDGFNGFLDVGKRVANFFGASFKIDDELIDTSLYRGGAPVRPKPGFYEDGGTFGAPPATSSLSTARGDNQELVQLLRETRDAIKDLSSRQYIAWDQQDTAELEDRLGERADDREAATVR